MDREKYKKLQINSHVPGREELHQHLIPNIWNNFVEGEWLPLSSQTHVLDSGMGEGSLLSHISELLQSPYVYGFDINPIKVQKAHERVRNHPILKDVDLAEQFVVGDMHEINFAGSVFDLVITHHTLEHCLDLNQTLLEFKRVLKPGGIVWGIVPYEPNNKEGGNGNAHTHPFLSEQQLRDEVSEHFQVLETRRWNTREPEIHFVLKSK